MKDDRSHKNSQKSRKKHAVNMNSSQVHQISICKK